MVTLVWPKRLLRMKLQSNSRKDRKNTQHLTVGIVTTNHNECKEPQRQMQCIVCELNLSPNDSVYTFQLNYTRDFLLALTLILERLFLNTTPKHNMRQK